MPNVIAVNQVIQIRIWTSTPDAFNQAAVNTIYYQALSVGASGATDQDIVTQIDSEIATQYKAMMTGAGVYHGVQGQLLGLVSPYSALFGMVFSNVNTGPGTVAGAILPTQVSGLISMGTPLAGRRHRGRIYIPFPGQADDSGQSTPTSGYVTKLNALRNLLFANQNISQGGRTAALLPVIMHSKREDGTKEAPTIITSHTSSSLWATQRKRGDFGRPNKSPI